jgi:hypothetical protein
VLNGEIAAVTTIVQTSGEITGIALIQAPQGRVSDLVLKNTSCQNVFLPDVIGQSAIVILKLD